MNATGSTSSFRSPRHKLIAFFQRSRDQWKEKCRKAKYETRLLDLRARSLQRSRDNWKRKAQEAQKRARELERQLEQQKNATA